jgi:hypothetical protein
LEAGRADFRGSSTVKELIEPSSVRAFKSVPKTKRKIKPLKVTGGVSARLKPCPEAGTSRTLFRQPPN